YVVRRPPISTIFHFVSPSGSGWSLQTATYLVPASAVRVVVVPQNSATGTFWFDDLSLSVTSNLISNPGFEAGAPGWSLAPQATIDTNAADAHAGNNCLQLTATAPWQGSAQYIPVTAGQTLTFSGWGKA